MAKKSPPRIRVLTSFQKRALLAEKTRKAKTLVRKHPAVAQAVVHLLPATAKMRKKSISAARLRALHLRSQLEDHALDAEKARTVRDTLRQATSHLKSLLTKSARHRALKKSRTVGTIALNAQEQAKRLNSVCHKKAEVKQEITAATSHFAKAHTPELKHKASTRLTLLHTTLAGLVYREKLLHKGRGVYSHPVASVHQMKHRLIPLGIPRMFRSPNREEAAMAIRLIASNRPRRKGESELQYRGTLRAYAKRALVRKINKPHLPSSLAVVEAVKETLQEDAPAVEEAAAIGSVPLDEIGNIVDPALQDAGEEMEESIIDFDPEADLTVQRGMIKENVQQAADAVLQQAIHEEAALAAEGEEPLDVLLPTSGGDSSLKMPSDLAPFYTKKEFLIPAALVVVGLFIAFRRKESE